MLCLVVSLLLYICGRWVERLRREEQQQRRQLEQGEERDDDGLFRLLEIQRGTTGLYHGGRYDTRFVSGFFLGTSLTVASRMATLGSSNHQRMEFRYVRAAIVGHQSSYRITMGSAGSD